MDQALLEEWLRAAYEKSFTGWDFSRLAGKMEETPLPWDYRALLEERFATAETCLDMGTGGGEFLDSFADLPAKTYASEGYAPNLQLAAERLQPRGIEVAGFDEDDTLPYESDFFDLVVNRHESYHPPEVARILKPGGIFVTQQIGGMNDIDINGSLGHGPPEHFDWCLLKAISELQTQDFNILACDEAIGHTRFADVASIVYYLKCIPWQIPDFTVAAYLERLTLLHEQIGRKGHQDFINHRFYLIAAKPEA